jgi:hypothetical protein
LQNTKKNLLLRQATRKSSTSRWRKSACAICCNVSSPRPLFSPFPLS